MNSFDAILNMSREEVAALSDELLLAFINESRTRFDLKEYFTELPRTELIGRARGAQEAHRVRNRVRGC